MNCVVSKKNGPRRLNASAGSRKRKRAPGLRTSADHYFELDFEGMAARVRVLAEVVLDAAGR